MRLLLILVFFWKTGVWIPIRKVGFCSVRDMHFMFYTLGLIYNIQEDLESYFFNGLQLLEFAPL